MGAMTLLLDHDDDDEPCDERPFHFSQGAPRKYNHKKGAGVQGRNRVCWPSAKNNEEGAELTQKKQNDVGFVD
jgi:hypothetical protein